jgi:hypothetical protein
MRELNECRTNPAAYAAKVESHIQYIKVNPNTDGNAKSTSLYDRDHMPKVSLNSGVAAFTAFAQKLRTMNPLPEIEFRNELAVDVPVDPSTWTSKEYIANTINAKKLELKKDTDFKNFNFHFDVGSNNAETSFILQLVDDTPFKGSRSKNILNPQFKYVGVRNSKIKNKNCGYFLFSN